MIYVTGDTHGSYKRLRAFFRNMPVTKSDVLIILGDTGLNYFADERDLPHQKSASRLPLTLLCLRGNHDRRVEGMACYRHETSFGGNVYFEDAYPDILFASEGGIYEMEGKSALLVGGAYSVDKEWRLSPGHNWFADEQISDACNEESESNHQARDWRIDTVLTHTCPFRFEPVEALI